MKGFIRVARLNLSSSEKILNSPDYGFSQPFDPQFGKMMVKTGAHLLGSFGEVVFGVSHSGEISILLAGVEEEGKGPDGRELLCKLSSEAAGKLTLLLGEPVSFNGTLYEFPAPEVAKKYFVWRQEDNRAYTLNRYFKFALLSSGTDLTRIPEMLRDFGDEEKVEILKQQEVDFEEVPWWQTRGVGLYWQAGLDDSEPSLMVEMSLPAQAEFENYMSRFL